MALANSWVRVAVGSDLESDPNLIFYQEWPLKVECTGFPFVNIRTTKRDANVPKP